MDVYTDKKLAEDILLMIKQNFSIIEIAKWAYHIYSTCNNNFSSNGEHTLHSLMMMEEGDEFTMSKDQLKTLAESLLIDKT